MAFNVNIKSDAFCWLLLLLAVPIYSCALIVLVIVVYLAKFAASDKAAGDDDTVFTVGGAVAAIVCFTVFIGYNLLVAYITVNDYQTAKNHYKYLEDHHTPNVKVD